MKGFTNTIDINKMKQAEHLIQPSMIFIEMTHNDSLI